MSKNSSKLHPRNRHHGQYDFDKLTQACSDLSDFVVINDYGNQSINFSDPKAVKTLNRALLAHFYQVPHWDLPEGYLCPPIPGRADYIHNIADLLASSCDESIPTGKGVRGLDIGIGANCVYPIIGHRDYGWSFVGSDIDPVAIKMASFIANNNPSLKKAIDCKLQKKPEHFFKHIIGKRDFYDFTMCNPPFHKSEEEANAGSQRKLDNLADNRSKRGSKNAAMMQKGNKPSLNFGGQQAELWCEGGEIKFISDMASESVNYASQCLWFTTLISKKENVSSFKTLLHKLGAVTIKTYEMAQGQKISRFVAWTFLDEEQQQQWYQE